MVKNERNKGITLIALVITIIVLLILAGVAISAISGNENTMGKAQEAKKNSQLADELDSIKLATVNAMAEGEYNLYVDATTLKNGLEGIVEEEGRLAITDTNYPWRVVGKTKRIYEISRTGEVTVKEKDPTLADLIPGENDTVTALNENANTPIKDIYGNDIIIPAGFGIAKDSGTSVQEGIVIEDAFSTGTDAVKKGSQFVWVPVGTFNIGDGEKVTGTKTVNLNRYDWSTNPVTTVTDGSAVKNKSTNSWDYSELDNQTVAHKDANGKIEAVEKAKAKGGFYIGRFETGSGNVCKYNVSAYIGITRDEAVTQATGMYTTKSTLYKTDLVNSYAWDTAIDFIQKCGDNETNTSSSYAYQIGDSDGGRITGQVKLKYNVNDTYYIQADKRIEDKQCNIYDMAGNVEEWTTEYSSGTDGTINRKPWPCVFRGGRFNGRGEYTANRSYTAKYSKNAELGFRPLLYVM